jgi:MFS family permease
MGIAFGLGFLFGPAIGGILTQVDLAAMIPVLGTYMTPFAAPAMLSLILGIINCIWVSKALTETLPEEKRKAAQASASSQKLVRDGLFGSSSIPRTNRAYFVFILIFSGLEFTLPFVAADRFNYSAVQVGYLFAYIGLVLMFTQGMIVRKLVPKLGERRMAMIGLVCGSISYWIVAKSTTVGMFYFGNTFLPMSIGMLMPSLSALVSLYSSPEAQGQNQGFFRSAGSLARAFGPISAAIAYFYVGPTQTYLFAAIAILTPILIVARLANPRPDAPEEVPQHG